MKTVVPPGSLSRGVRRFQRREVLPGSGVMMSGTSCPTHPAGIAGPPVPTTWLSAATTSPHGAGTADSPISTSSTWSMWLNVPLKGKTDLILVVQFR